jgi:hypothetical protein
MKNDWLLYLDHEPGNPWVRVREDGKGWYKFVEEKEMKPQMNTDKHR